MTDKKQIIFKGMAADRCERYYLPVFSGSVFPGISSEISERTHPCDQRNLPAVRGAADKRTG